MTDFASVFLDFVLGAPFALPYVLLEPGLPPRCGWSFSSPPYAAGAPGYLALAVCPPDAGGASGAADPAGESSRPSASVRRVAGQAEVEGLAAPDGDYARLQARARFLTASRFELDAAFGDYVDGAGAAPRGWFGQTHVDVRFAQSPRVQFRAGAGVRERLAAGKGYVGFDALYAADVYWPTPFATSIEISGGTLGVNGWAAEVRGTFGYVVGRAEVYGGWDASWVGASRQATNSLGGPVIGARMYF